MNTPKKALLLFLAILVSVLLVINLALLVYATSLKVTILNPLFLQEELEELKAYPLAKESMLKEIRLRDPVPPLMTEALDRTVSVEWMRSQGNRFISAMLAYLRSESDTFDFRLSLEEVKGKFLAELKESLRTSPPQELKGLSPELREKYFSELSQKIDQGFPREINPSPEQLKMLEQVKVIVTNFYLGSTFLLVLAAVLTIFLVLLKRRVRAILRLLGIVLIISGVLSYSIAQLLIKMIPAQTGMLMLPVPLTPDLLSRFTSDLLSPAVAYSLGLMALGLICLAFPFFLLRLIYSNHPKAG